MIVLFLSSVFGQDFFSIFISLFSFFVIFVLCYACLGAGEFVRWASILGSQDESSIWYPPPYDVKTYVRDFAANVHTTRFSKVGNFGTALAVTYRLRVLDTAIGAWQKRWNP